MGPLVIAAIVSGLILRRGILDDPVGNLIVALVFVASVYGLVRPLLPPQYQLPATQ